MSKSPPPRLMVSLLTVLATLPAGAQNPVPLDPPPTSFFGELLAIVVPLAFIILALFAVLHLARRRYGLRGTDAPLTVVQVLPLGPRERIVLVKSRTGRLFAVGVGTQSVNLLTDLDPAELVPVAADADTEAVSTPGATVLGKPLIRRDLLAGLRPRPKPPR